MIDPLAQAAPPDWMQDSPIAVPKSGRGPYGLVGLTISTIAILVVTLLLVALLAALVFAGAGLVIGWHAAVNRFTDLRTAAGSQEAFLERIGVVVSLVVYAALIGVILGAARWRGRGGWRNLIGWQPWTPLKASRLFWSVVAAMIVYGLGADVLVAKLYPPSKEWVNLPAGPLWAASFVTMAVVAAPVAEELLFRGWLYTALRGRIGVRAGILLSSVLFALAHWEKTHIYALAVFPVGLALGFIRERTGSLRASMAAHAAYNGAASVLLVLGF